MRKMKKALAVALSASMVMGMSMTTFAADQEVSVDAPIYSLDVTQVVVPTTFVVAFNPDGLSVDVDGDGTGDTTDQIVSKNYGIINKSSKDKMITVTLNVEDLNEDKISFVDAATMTPPSDPGMMPPSDPDMTPSISPDEYALNLQVVPADASGVTVGDNPANLETTGADLVDVKMTPATSAAMDLMPGENEVSFLLKKAEYEGAINLNSTNGNNVAGQIELTDLDKTGKGITAFTFGGIMNANADWAKLTKGIRITAVYSNENAPNGAEAMTGTGALYSNPNPVFKTGDDVGTIRYKAGIGDDAIKSISKVEIDNNGKIYDGYNASGTLWSKATDANGVITLDSKYLAFYTKSYPNAATINATITYVTTMDDTRTATVDVRLKAQVGPSFTTGSAVGSINYTVGTGDKALASITKIEMSNKGTIYDGYNASGSLWANATDVNGVITFDSKYMAYYTKSYPSDATIEATITYVTAGGATQTATVDVKLK